jgi:hypothetical protein
MKNTIRLFTGVSILVAIFMPMNLNARIRQHRIGYGYNYGGELDTCRYWIADDKNKKVVFNELYEGRYAYMNIDNEKVRFILTDRQEVKRNSRKIGYKDKYKNTNFQVDTYFIDVSTDKDKKFAIFRRKGTLVIRDNNSWQKNLQVECVAAP